MLKRVSARQLLSPALIRGFATNATTAVVGTVVLSNFVRIFSSAVLTRLLSASDYGVVGIITSITYIIVMLSDFGFYSFIVRHEGPDDPRFLDQVWTIRLIRSAGVTALLVALSYPYAVYAGKPVLAPVIAVWAFGQVIDGFGSLAFAQAVRQGLVTRLSWVEFATSIVQVLITILFAMILHNYWAIVVAVLVSGVMKTTLSYLAFPDTRRRWNFSRERGREVWRFSRFIAGSSVLTLLLGQSDKVVLSRVLPLDLFGIYAIATLLALAPRAVVYPYCSRILFPAYSKAYREGGLAGFAAAFYPRRRLVSMVFMFIMGGMIGTAPLIVAVLYDPRYAGVAPLLRIVAVSATLMLNNVSTEEALIATGRPKTSLQLNLTRFVWLASAGALGLTLVGPMGVVYAVGTVEIAAMAFSWYSLRRLGVLRLREELLPLGCALTGAAIGLAGNDAILALGWF